MTILIHARINNRDYKLSANHGDTVLDALLMEGIDARNSCMSGACTTCKLKTDSYGLSGLDNIDPQKQLTKKEVGSHVFLACQAKINSKVSLLRITDIL